MKLDSAKKKLREKIEMHLRGITRKLITFDTVQETLNYLLESFYKEFTCDLVAVLLKEGEMLIPKVWIGDDIHIDQTFHLSLEECAPNLLEYALWGPAAKEEQKTCVFADWLKKERISTWFTVPLKNNDKSLGLCVIGFHDFVPLIIEAEQNFTEFGRDVVAAIDLAQEKEEQKRKIKGIEWLRETSFIGSSIESVIEQVVKRAAKGTNAKGACIYLYDEVNKCFTLTPPTYGDISLKKEIFIDSAQTIDHYFPSVEKAGKHEITVPLIVNLKTIGMLYVCHEKGHSFASEDLEVLKFVSAFVSMHIENARLYQVEYENKRRLEKILDYHQALVKKTVEGKDLQAITETVGSMLGISLFLYDRFFRKVTSYIKEEKAHLCDLYEKKISSKKTKITQMGTKELWIEDNHFSFSVWPIVGGTDFLGYLVICLEEQNVDRVLRLTFDYTLNVFALEFIKQKLVIDAREQEKESFINQLFAQTIDDEEKVITYATLINWNVFESHRVAVLSLEVSEMEDDLIASERYKTWLWDRIKAELMLYHPHIIFTRKGNDFIFIVKKLEEIKVSGHYWGKLYKQIKHIVQNENDRISVYLGIGNFTETLKDYYYSYVKAVKAKNVVSHRLTEKGYAYYDDLGSYTILNNTSDPLAAELFIKKHLAPLIQYSKENNVDLFQTLYLFLQHNGNYREASKKLYIHRSTLEYRIERIEEILKIDLNNADMRFELMMAYKLYSLFDFDRDKMIVK